MLNDGSKAYAYDQANQLTGITADGLTWSATYNGDGARLRQVNNGVPTTYTLDLNTGLVQVLVQQEATSTTRYLYGVTRLGEQQTSGWAYHLGDALGSVRQLAEGNGNVTLSESYDPYGSLLSSQGRATSAFGFTGEQMDSYIQLVFLRARYMQPGLGVFLSRDALDGDTFRPLTFNAWSYVQDNPINSADALGLCTNCRRGSICDRYFQ